jgi:hypothetical protein
MEIQEVLEEIRPSLVQRHLYLDLPPFDLREGKEWAGVTVLGGRVRINPRFCERLGEHISPRETLTALLDHVLDHRVYAPAGAGTYLTLYSRAKKLFRRKEKALTLLDAFLEVVVDTYRMKWDKETPLPHLYRALLQASGISPLQVTLGCLRQRIWGQDLGVSGFEEIVDPLSQIPYLDPGQWKRSLLEFAIPLRDLIEEEYHPFHPHSLLAFLPREVSRGLRDFSQEVKNPSAFREVLWDFQGELLAMGLLEHPLSGILSPRRGEAVGRGKGDPQDADILFYMKRAERFHLPVEKLRIEKDGSLYPLSHVPWETGRPVQDLDYWNSLGIRILPGITQVWKREESEVLERREEVPDCLIALDSSGSMPNPARETSYAVLGACCAADAYLRNGAEVAVVNFSDALEGDEKIQGYTRDRRAIYTALCRYFQGGSAPDLQGIRTLLSGRKADLLMITDMAIDNLQEMIEYLKGVENRVTVLYLGPNEYSRVFQREVEGRPHITVYSVVSQEDIPKIVLGKIKRDLGVREGVGRLV